MTKRLTQNQVIENFKKVHGDKYNYEHVIYINSNVKVKIECPKHGIFLKRYHNHYKLKQGCPKCSPHRGLTHKEIISKFKGVHGDIYDYSQVLYINRDTKVEIICRKHGSFWQTPTNHITGNGCKQCYIERFRKDTPHFINNAKKVHGDKYDYSRVKYKTLKTKVEIICRKHGSFWQTPNNHITGNGCPQCGLDDKQKTKAELNREFESNKWNVDLNSYVNNRTKMSAYCPVHGKFDTLPKNLRNGHGCPKCTYSVSESEILLQQFIRYVINADIYTNVRGVITNEKGNKCELDIAIPEYMLAIEFNGIYWHTEQRGKGRKYHLHKTIECEKQGINLLHIFESEWKDSVKRKIWMSIIINKLKQSHRIYARKCQIIKVTKKDAADFFNNNHIQGNVGYEIVYGLEYNGKLVSAMSFGRPRYNKKYNWELLRMCHILGSTVVGGFGKLLKHFQKNHSGSVISYANRRFSNGNVYNKLGFQFLESSKPSYHYVKNDKIYHRSMFMKHKLHKRLDTYDSTLTEYENMLQNGYDRIWDCGTHVFVLEN